MKIPGNQGYEDEAESLIHHYEQLSFEDAHQHVLDFIPQYPATIADIGAGTGRDAGYLADLGHRVVAVEPTRAFFEAAQKLHPSKSIIWVADHLPSLAKIITRAGSFDLVMISAVWMHLDQEERQLAMPIVASLLKTDAILMMSLRHGPVPKGRRMFEIPTDEMLDLAAQHGLEAIRHVDSDSISPQNQSNGVTWTHFIFRKTRR